ncbi:MULTISPECIES: ABC1 kinase family protein [Chryseobacterium]|uniref:Ubiquinone biosynthesis protein n=1 Tax=Chryseobacterium camelliae TaxID=1265445 RepID=A0ABU0TFD1_9FLAO|nr:MULTISPECIES: AarF/UbiB family protein [Chryseobacterium]MDT3406485.1 ubiquinone biosynthesis protein [Pseudacidovorax intermedius]MDQ1095717.1 ubiquinone biosynthesis protein [Chryseobacterium camelliae]MDQ1099653.1 ubiquinone biosynthesis protein [Chryseobacterium sp. SORGH_AS_1048]MDR6087002.1 ubiquinone biosynthesis protein [Chryseobacterium sp. SORGH_AS_0909]MDR6131374.1 ubiquinone biosynthesis protein [Chryseobacterium sp. SORGH_AS_1175]
MFDKQQRKLKRSARLISVLSKYGFRDLLARMNGGNKQEDAGGDVDLDSSKGTVYERIRMVLEELGPTFVKLGQSFSNREDLLPIELIRELEKLQDKVETVAMNVGEILENELDISVEDHFLEIDEKPLATASIAQVYRAVLKDGSPVILKIKKPNVQAVIEDDLLLIKDLEKLVSSYSDIGERLNLKQAISTFEKSLLEEISLINEKENILQFARNFKNEPETYVPKVYEELSNNNVLCMEFIDGIKVTDLSGLRNHGLDPVKISEVGLRLFVSQILDYGFFHADPHAGNILVKKDGKVVFIDFGAVGKIQPNDKEILEELIVSFVAKNARKIVRSLKKMAIRYEIPDERKFESDVQEIINYIHSASLQDIDVQDIINTMKDVLQENRLYMPGYFYLLFKGISLIEGVGRNINPDLDIVKSLHPYTKKILARKINPKNLLKSGMDRMMDFTDSVDEIPRELRSVLQKLDENKFTISSEIKNMDTIGKLIRSSVTNIILAIVLGANIIATAVVMVSEKGPKIGEMSLIAILGFVFSVFLVLVLLLRVNRK